MAAEGEHQVSARGLGSPSVGLKQGAAGSQGPRSTLNIPYSAGEMLKAPVDVESGYQTPWYSLVGAEPGCPHMVGWKGAERMAKGHGKTAPSPPAAGSRGEGKW